jgi:hypothetical protein
MGEREDIEARMRKLADDIKALSPPEQLRLAAELLENRQADLAYQVIDRVRLELGAALVIARRALAGPREDGGEHG